MSGINFNIGGGRAGGFGVSMLPSSGNLVGSLNQFAGQVGSFGPILDKIVREVVQPRIEDNFVNMQAASSADNWASLAEDTPFMPYRQAHGDGPTLDVTGKLKRVAQQMNIWSFDNRQGIAFVNNLPGAEYGEIQQQGGPNYGLRGDLADIPPRPFIIINEQDIKDAEELFSEWVSENFNKTVGYVVAGKTVGGLASGEQ